MISSWIMILLFLCMIHIQGEILFNKRMSSTAYRSWGMYFNSHLFYIDDCGNFAVSEWLCFQMFKITVHPHSWMILQSPFKGGKIQFTKMQQRPLFTNFRFLNPNFWMDYDFLMNWYCNGPSTCPVDICVLIIFWMSKM